MNGDQPEKIVYLIDSYLHPNAGTERQLYNLVKNIDRSKFLPELVVFRSSEYLESSDFPCPHVTLGINRIFSFDALWKLLRFARNCRRRGVRLIHIFFNDASIIGPVILRIFGLKVIISRRDMGFWYSPLNVAVLRFNSMFVNAVVANCEAVKELTHTREWITRDRIHVIYNGYDGRRNDPDIDDCRTDEYEKLFDGKRTVGIVANIRPIKRIGDLIVAFSQVCDTIPDAGLVIVGGGDDTGLRAIATKLGILDRVFFLGARDDADLLMRHFDVGVICSESEGFSNTIVEYMFAGVPVICTRTGGNTELVIDNETGFLIDVGDVDDMACKISLVLSGTPDLRRITRNAYERVTQLCSLETMLDRHYSLYRNLLNPR